MAYTLTYALFNNDTEYKVTGYTGEPIDVVIPSTYNGLPVTSIGKESFHNCGSLVSIKIPTSVKSIGSLAFAGSSLTSIRIPDSVTSISDSAFYSCESLKNIEIPDSVTTIGDYAFDNCRSLTSITIPDGVTSIGRSIFSGCSNLTNVVIPDSVTSIGAWAFADCRSLTSVVIPNNVTKISDYTFDNCSSLTNITLLSKIPATITAYVFLDLSSEAKFYCLSSAIDSYKSATNWNEYSSHFIADDMRLYFTMNARAQKKYFARKLELDSKLSKVGGTITGDLTVNTKLITPKVEFNNLQVESTSDTLLLVSGASTKRVATESWVSEKISNNPTYRGTVSDSSSLGSYIARDRADANNPLKIGDYYRASADFTIYAGVNEDNYFYDSSKLEEQVHAGDLIIYNGEASITFPYEELPRYDYLVDVIHSDDPGYYVTTNTNQEITGTKTFIETNPYSSYIIEKAAKISPTIIAMSDDVGSSSGVFSTFSQDSYLTPGELKFKSYIGATKTTIYGSDYIEKDFVNEDYSLETHRYTYPKHSGTLTTEEYVKNYTDTKVDKKVGDFNNGVWVYATRYLNSGRWEEKALWTCDADGTKDPKANYIIPLYHDNHLCGGDPVNPYHYVNKRYADTKVPSLVGNDSIANGDRVYVHIKKANGTDQDSYCGLQWNEGTSEPTVSSNGAIPQISNGYIAVRTPDSTKPYAAVNVKYADTKVESLASTKTGGGRYAYVVDVETGNGRGVDTLIQIAPTGIGNSVILYDKQIPLYDKGRLSGADPTYQYNYATKNYVDSKLGSPTTYYFERATESQKSYANSYIRFDGGVLFVSTTGVTFDDQSTTFNKFASLLVGSFFGGGGQLSYRHFATFFLADAAADFNQSFMSFIANFADGTEKTVRAHAWVYPHPIDDAGENYEIRIFVELSEDLSQMVNGYGTDVLSDEFGIQVIIR